MSWDEGFSYRYEEWAAHMTADVAFYVGLARQANGPLVELAIGNGRVAIPVAQATGRKVIGIDSSPSMLEQARRGASEAGVELELIEGRMQDLALTDHTVTCTVDPDGLVPLLTALTGAGVRSLTSTPPTLEELFLDLYRSPGSEASR